MASERHSSVELPKLAIVVSHPTQYYSPWFRWLAIEAKLRLKVFYLWEFGVTKQRDPKFETAFQWDVDLLSGYESEFVPNTAKKPGTDHFGGLRNPTLTRRLAAWAPEAILLFGYKWNSHLRVIAWARTRRIPLLFRGDSHFIGRGAPPWRTRILLRTLYSQFAMVLPVGAANRDYFATLGVPADRQFFAPHSVNHRLFNPSAATHREAAARLRTELNLPPDTRVILYAGKLVPEKQPGPLLEAFLKIATPRSALIIVGEGPEKQRLQTLAGRDSARQVRFLPFANQTEMPVRYLLADIFALPSAGLYETWGLAINEAMHMGVPCLVSDRVGCQRDLVTPGETGWVFSASDLDDLRRTLAKALDSSPAEMAHLKANVATRIAGYTYAQTAAGLLEALRHLHAFYR